MCILTIPPAKERSRDFWLTWGEPIMLFWIPNGWTDVQGNHEKVFLDFDAVHNAECEAVFCHDIS